MSSFFFSSAGFNLSGLDNVGTYMTLETETVRPSSYTIIFLFDYLICCLFVHYHSIIHYTSNSIMNSYGYGTEISCYVHVKV